MKKFYTLAFLISILSISHTRAQSNLSLLGQLSYPVDLSNLWGWSDGAGHEYAIVGTEDGTSIVDITDPTAPTEVQFVDGVNSIWREVRTWSHYAYVVTEGGGGLLCIDLSGLPGSVSYNYTDGGIGINSGHTVFCDEHGIVHVFGSNLYSGGDVMFDANVDPLDPPYLGNVNEWYIHDGYAHGDTLWAANIYNGWFSVWDISDKALPVLIGQQSTPNTFTHNVAVTPDDHYIYTTDEVSGASVASYDVSDLTDIKKLDEFQSVPGTEVIPHNTYVVGNFLVTSYYTDGVMITDATHPDNLIKTGWYDTSPAYSGGTFNGCWGVCPTLPSGVIIASDIENGLYVLQPTYVQACYLVGNVTDASSGLNLYDVSVTVSLSPDAATSTDLSGNYKTGVANGGLYDVTFIKTGYAPLTISDVNLDNGLTTTLNAEMESLTPFILTGTVVDATSGLGVPNAQLFFQGTSSAFFASADASGNFSIPGSFVDTYTAFAGAWGYTTLKTAPTFINSSDPFVITISRGYYDDFLFTYNWTVSTTASTGAWVKGVPAGTISGSDYANPNLDASDDFGDQCFMTGNGGGGPGEDDVDDGNTILTSPSMDLSSAINPKLFYERWFYDGSGAGFPNDSLSVFISNGLTSVQVDEIHNLGPESQWVAKEIIIKDHIDLTADMHVIFRTADQVVAGNVVEAGVDKFYVTDTTVNAVEDITSGISGVYPNPFTGSFTINLDGNLPVADYSIEITDLTGKVVAVQQIQSGTAVITVGKSLSAGVYILNLKNDNQLLGRRKIIKIE